MLLQCLVKRRPSSSKENSGRAAKMILLVESPLLFLTRRRTRTIGKRARTFSGENLACGTGGLAFAPVRLKYAKNYACPAGYYPDTFYAVRSVLVPRDRARFGQPQKSRALNESRNTGSPRFMRGLPVQSSLANLIG